MTNSEFSAKVGKIVKEQYGLDGGRGLCFNHVEMGDISVTDSPESAAQYVAQLIEQA